MTRNGTCVTPIKTEMQKLKRRIWVGTLAFDLLLLVATAVFWPSLLRYAGAGILLGFYYLWSLFWSAEHPKGAVQFVFSLTKLVVLAYLIVKITQGRLPEFALVMSGLLSYKVVLTVETARQATQAFRSHPSKSGKQPVSPPADPT